MWDCYLRDGEVFAWRAAVELLRLLAPKLDALPADTPRAAALRLLLRPAAAAGVGEKALFHTHGSLSLSLSLSSTDV